MACAAVVLPSIEIGRKLVAPAMFLMLPLALVRRLGYSARKQTKEEERKAVWLGHRRLSRFGDGTKVGHRAPADLRYARRKRPFDERVWGWGFYRTDRQFGKISQLAPDRFCNCARIGTRATETRA